jgi:Rap1a immunity proteins
MGPDLRPEPGLGFAARLVVASLAVGFLAVAVSVSPLRAHEFYTGNEWLKKCSDGAPDVGMGMCVGYLIAISDLRLLLPEGARHCPEKGVTVNQARQVAVKYLRDNPAKTHLPFMSVVLDALREAFPCKK